MKTLKRIAGLLLAFCMTASLVTADALAAGDAEYQTTIHVMTIEERNIFGTQTEYTPRGGIAYLPKNNAAGSSGNICAPFTADKENVAFVILSAPGAIDYNVQLYVGEPGEGSAVSNYAVVGVNNGVYLIGLTVGQSYYFKISSSSLVISGCNAQYSMFTYDAGLFE